MVEIVLAAIAAIGTVLTAYVTVLARRTEASVNGATDHLLGRIERLELRLLEARAAPAESMLPLPPERTP